ncbi:MAG: S-layer homology domain-containing protein, partial [Butyricicoccus sp.]
MKRTLLRLLSAVCAAGLLVTPAMAAGIDSFPDASGHWAYDALSRAVEDALLQGDEEGRLLPSGSLTVAQMTAIL